MGSDYRGLPFEELRRVSLSLHKEKRRAHTQGVSDTAVQLAQKYGADMQLAARAGILHDVTKALTPGEQQALIGRWQLPVTEFERANPQLLHAKTGAAAAQSIFGESDAVVSAMPDGERRRLNVSLLCDYAEKYEAAGNLGLSGFIRFIDKVARTSGDLATAARPSENADIVRIMTVHQSKGLEFPICILADMQHKFNERDNSDSVLINSYAGLGMKRRTEDGISVYDTAPRRAAVIMSERMGRSEELRVLYVALTRAKENLIMVTSVPNPEKSFAKVAVECGIGEKANPVCGAENE